ncbi:hypothetical protein BJ170DRAFT_711292 [Xylariales sp. AK1849]|nr:hypothetical protein BJ170DRAFT_711292 [Xylariales sp. AK1849]
MCNEVHMRFQECRHRCYQNTYLCHVARRCSETEDMLLDEAQFLPTRPSKIPPGLLSCKTNVATRPVPGYCPECRGAKAMQQAAGTATPPSSSSSSKTTVGGADKPTQSLTDSGRFGEIPASTPSPDVEVVRKVSSSS